MGAALKAGFAIGVAVAALLGFYAWRGGPSRAPGAAAPQAMIASERPAPPSSGGRRDATTPSAKPDSGASPQATLPAPTSPDARGGGETTPQTRDDIARRDPAAPVPATPDRARDMLAGGAFDIVRAEPTGELVIAGRCLAGCSVELLSDGRVHDAAKADDGGAWAMTPNPLAPGDHQLALRTKGPDGVSRASAQSVTVSVPTPPSKQVVVVLNEPDAPSRVLQKPRDPQVADAAPDGAGAAPAAKPFAGPLSVAAVDAENGRFFVQGSAPAGARLRIYLNGSMIAEPLAGVDGRWSLRVDRGLAPGDYSLRVDRIEGAGGNVSERAEARFDYAPEAASKAPQAAAKAPQVASKAPEAAKTPEAADRATAQPAPDSGAAPSAAPAATPEPAAKTPSAAGPAASVAAAEPAAAADPANPVVANLDTVKVRRGDSLWRISRTSYGKGRRYTILFAANDSQIRDPDLIYPGQVLVVPEKSGATASERR